MSMPALFKGRLSLPVIGAPLFIISVPDLVIAQCKAGIVGSFPARARQSRRPEFSLREWRGRWRSRPIARSGRRTIAGSPPRTPMARVVEKDMDEDQHRIERLDRFQKPDRRDGIDGYDLDHSGLAGPEIHRAMDVDALTPARSRNCPGLAAAGYNFRRLTGSLAGRNGPRRNRFMVNRPRPAGPQPPESRRGPAHGW